MILIILNSIQRGFGEGIKTTIGVVVADAVLIVLTASGLGTLLYASATAFTVVKWAGAIYLIYLGVKQLTSQIPKDTPQEQAKGNAVLQGFGVTMLNPKIIGFFIAFFPQFLSPAESIWTQLSVLVPVFLAIVFVFMAFYAAFAAQVSHFMTGYRGKKTIKNTSGVSLIGCGLFSAMME